MILKMILLKMFGNIQPEYNKLFNKTILYFHMTEKLKNYQRVCVRCNESFRTTSKSSRICFKCSKNKLKSVGYSKDLDKEKAKEK